MARPTPREPDRPRPATEISLLYVRMAPLSEPVRGASVRRRAGRRGHRRGRHEGPTTASSGSRPTSSAGAWCPCSREGRPAHAHSEQDDSGRTGRGNRASSRATRRWPSRVQGCLLLDREIAAGKVGRRGREGGGCVVHRGAQTLVRGAASMTPAYQRAGSCSGCRRTWTTSNWSRLSTGPADAP